MSRRRQALIAVYQTGAVYRTANMPLKPRINGISTGVAGLR